MSLDILPYLAYYPRFIYTTLTVFSFFNVVLLTRMTLPMFHPNRMRLSYDHVQLRDHFQNLLDFHSKTLEYESRIQRQLAAFNKQRNYWRRLVNISLQMGIELNHINGMLRAIEQERDGIQNFWSSRKSLFPLPMGRIVFPLAWEAVNELHVLLPKAKDFLQQQDDVAKSLMDIALEMLRELKAYNATRAQVIDKQMSRFFSTPSEFPCDPDIFRVRDMKEILSIFWEVDEALEKCRENKYFNRISDYMQTEYFPFAFTASGYEVLHLKYVDFPIRYRASGRQLAQLENWFNARYYMFLTSVKSAYKQIRGIRIYFRELQKLYDRKFVEDLDNRFKRVTHWYFKNTGVINLTFAVNP